MEMLDRLALTLLIIGGINWGSVGLFQFDLVAFLCGGDETDEYVNDPGNLELWVVNSALIYDPALTEFITAPYGTTIVRVSSDRFEPDEPGKEIFIEKN